MILVSASKSNTNSFEFKSISVEFDSVICFITIFITIYTHYSCFIMRHVYLRTQMGVLQMLYKVTYGASEL